MGGGVLVLTAAVMLVVLVGVGVVIIYEGKILLGCDHSRICIRSVESVKCFDT